MIETRRAQRTFGDGLIAEEVRDLHEDWMKHADQVLADKEIVAADTRLWRGGIPTAAAAVGGARQPRWCCVCWC